MTSNEAAQQSEPAQSEPVQSEPVQSEPVRLEVADGIATIRLARPPMNALDVVMQEQIRLAAREAGERDDVAAVVVYGGENAASAIRSTSGAKRAPSTMAMTSGTTKPETCASSQSTATVNASTPTSSHERTPQRTIPGDAAVDHPALRGSLTDDAPLPRRAPRVGSGVAPS